MHREPPNTLARGGDVNRRSTADRLVQGDYFAIYDGLLTIDKFSKSLSALEISLSGYFASAR